MIVLQGEVYFRNLDAEQFSLQANMFGDKICFSLWADEAKVIGEKFDLFLFLRARAEEVIECGMDETSAAVTKGVLFGDTMSMDEELYDNVRRGGIAHIFAVSGLHVGALFAFCLLLTKKTALRRLPKFLRFLFLSSHNKPLLFLT